MIGNRFPIIRNRFECWIFPIGSMFEFQKKEYIVGWSITHRKITPKDYKLASLPLSIRRQLMHDAVVYMALFDN